jgi:dihydropteroate synthase-like protein
MPETLLFLTGHLAYENLCRELAEINSSDFHYRVENIGVKVAALMTTAIVSRRLQAVEGVDRVIMPGLFAGELDALSAQFGLPFISGPKDLRDLPEFFGSQPISPDLSAHAIRIFAEIVDAPHLSIDQIIRRARELCRDGANVIDIGCLPGVKFPHLKDTVVALKQAGFSVSIDSLEVEDLRLAANAGADFLLSLKESTLWLADEVAAIPVLIPDATQDMDSLYRSIDRLLSSGKPFVADAILEPFPYGFTASIVRYNELRTRYPACDILMGTGNITELMDADTSGITSLLISMAAEMRVGSILTTEVSPHACRAVREADLARRIMFAAQRDKQLPRRYDTGLMTIHDKKPFPYTATEIASIADSIKDKSYRIQVSEEGIHLYNREGFKTAGDPYDLIGEINVGEDLSHMFYLGVELGRAQIAWQLGKRYSQDSELEWGVAQRAQAIVADGAGQP